MNTNRQQLLTDALAAAEAGWHVFPLRPNDKRPAINDWEARATTDRRAITNCWAAGAFNIGIACGPSHLVVVDLDVLKRGRAVPRAWAKSGVREGRQVLDVLADDAFKRRSLATFAVTTGSGGTHLYFTAPSGEQLRNSAGRIGWLIDTRANGGYVVAAGSTVAGRPYRIAEKVPSAPLPEWIATALRPAVGAPARAVTRIGEHSRYAAAALRNELDRVLAAEPGTRNHTLNASAFSLGQLVASGMLSEELTTAALHLAAAAIGLPDHETTATVRSGLTAGAKHPRAISP
jgi:hypothetical protein